MGSSLSAVIAELTMEQGEEEAFTSSSVKPRWWRYSNACLKNGDFEPFYKQLNSINPHIQFTLEMPSAPTGHPINAFLDTYTTVLAIVERN